MPKELLDDEANPRLSIYERILYYIKAISPYKKLFVIAFIALGFSVFTNYKATKGIDWPDLLPVWVSFCTIIWMYCALLNGILIGIGSIKKKITGQTAKFLLLDFLSISFLFTIISTLIILLIAYLPATSV